MAKLRILTHFSGPKVSIQAGEILDELAFEELCGKGAAARSVASGLAEWIQKPKRERAVAPERETAVKE